MDRGAWWPIVNGVASVGHDLVTKPSSTSIRTHEQVIRRFIPFDTGGNQ